MKVKQQLTRKYYKYITVESSWTQPVLSSNGTIGVDDFAVTADFAVERAYYPFRGGDSAWRGQIGKSLIMYSNNALCIKRLGFSCDSTYYVKSFTLYGSNDGNSWNAIQSFTQNVTSFVTFEINNNNFYKYYKFYVNDAKSGNCYLMNMQLTATQQTTSIAEGTKDDYDFYEEEIALNAFVDNNVYKAMKF